MTFTPIPSPLAVTPGVSFGSGVMDAGTQRVVLASDGPTVSTLTAINAKLPAALGRTTMAASLSVALASDQAGVNVSPDNVQEGVAGVSVITGSVTSATTVVSAAMAGFSGGSFQVTSGGSGNTITFEQSNDGSTWVVLQVMADDTTSASAASTTGGAALRSFRSSAAFVRARVSTYGSGTVAITLNLKRTGPQVSGLTLGGGTSTIGNLTRQSGFTDSTTNLTASSTFTGTSRTSAANYSRFCATAFADQTGTLNIEQSLDSGSTWQVVATAAVAVSTPTQLTVNVTGLVGSTNLFRVRYVNGGTNQGLFRLSSAFLQ